MSIGHGRRQATGKLTLNDKERNKPLERPQVHGLGRSHAHNLHRQLVRRGPSCCKVCVLTIAASRLFPPVDRVGTNCPRWSCPITMLNELLEHQGLVAYRAKPPINSGKGKDGSTGASRSNAVDHLDRKIVKAKARGIRGRKVLHVQECNLMEQRCLVRYIDYCTDSSSGNHVCTSPNRD